jgi:WD40 repeat protein
VLELLTRPPQTERSQTPRPDPRFHEGPLACVDMRGDGLLASGGYDGRIGLWEASGRRLAWLEGHTALVNAVAWSPDGRCLASASSDRTTRVWDVERPVLLATLSGHRDDVNAVAWSPDGECLLSGSFDGTARVVERRSGRCRAVLEGHAADVNGVAWSPDGRLLATASDDRTARLWTPEGALVRALGGHGDWVDAVAFSPDGRIVVTACLDRVARVFEVGSGALRASLDAHGCTVKAVRFSPDGRFLATGAYDRRIRVFETEGFAQVAELVDARMWNRTLAWGRAGRLATGSFGGAPVQWRIGDREARTPDRLGAPGINGAALSPDGTRAAFACDDGAARIVCLRRGRILRERLDHGGPLLAAAWSRDGRRVAFGGWDGRASVHDASGAAPLAWIPGLDGPVNSLAFGEDAATLAVGSFLGTLSLWGAADGRLREVAGRHPGSIKCVTALPGGGGFLSSGRDGTVRLHAGGGPRVLLACRGIVNAVAPSRDGRRLAAATRGSGVRVVDRASGRTLAVFRDPAASARAVALSADGTRLASGHYDGCVLLASPGRGAPRIVRPFGATPISGVAFLPGDRHLLVSTWHARGRFGLLDARSGERVAAFALGGAG